MVNRLDVPAQCSIGHRPQCFLDAPLVLELPAIAIDERGGLADLGFEVGARRRVETIGRAPEEAADDHYILPTSALTDSLDFLERAPDDRDDWREFSIIATAKLKDASRGRLMAPGVFNYPIARHRSAPGNKAPNQKSNSFISVHFE